MAGHTGFWSGAKDLSCVLCSAQKTELLWKYNREVNQVLQIKTLH